MCRTCNAPGPVTGTVGRRCPTCAKAGQVLVYEVSKRELPRWVGDTNFLPVLFDTRIISVDLHAMCRRLKSAFRKATKSKRRS